MKIARSAAGLLGLAMLLLDREQPDRSIAAGSSPRASGR